MYMYHQYYMSCNVNMGLDFRFHYTWCVWALAGTLISPPLASLQPSNSSLDHYAMNGEGNERRSSMDNKHHKLERKGSGNNSERQTIYERTKRASLERRSSSGDRLSVTPDNLSPCPASSPGLATVQSKKSACSYMRVAVTPPNVSAWVVHISFGDCYLCVVVWTWAVSMVFNYPSFL